MAAVDLLNRVKVKAMIFSDRRVGVLDIDVEVHDGTALLRGEVESEEQKQIAEQLTWEVDGISEVENEIRVVPESQTMAPDQGEVILPAAGMVGDTMAAPGGAAGPGITGAVPPHWWMPTEEAGITTSALTEAVERRIAEDGRITSRNIHVTVDGTRVTLQGTVDSLEESYLVQDAAESVTGITEVNNELQIEEGHTGHKCNCGRM